MGNLPGSPGHVPAPAGVGLGVLCFPHTCLCDGQGSPFPPPLTSEAALTICLFSSCCLSSLHHPWPAHKADPFSLSNILSTALFPAADSIFHWWGGAALGCDTEPRMALGAEQGALYLPWAALLGRGRLACLRRCPHHPVAQGCGPGDWGPGEVSSA